MITGDFETHITVAASKAEELAVFAAEHGLGFVHIELDRGDTPSQPMLTLHGSGTLDRRRAEIRDWYERLRAAGFRPVRNKIEATPWSIGVPQTDREARDEPADRYFEHHIKVRLPSERVTDVLAVTDIAERHGARLSRNARRRDPDGRPERFVNQRCHRSGRADATERLDALVHDLRAAGHEVVSAEQEYVVHDSQLALDRGWLSPVVPCYQDRYEDRNRTAPAGPGFPPTYRPIPRGWEVEQRAAFDPALKQHRNAYTAGEPHFTDPDLGQRWRGARRKAMRHLLTMLAASRWAGHLVLRGSAAMEAWVGASAREPGDLDFVITPRTVTSDSSEAGELFAGILTALTDVPGAGLRPGRAAQSAIWTYERADGRRLVIPFEVPGLPDGTVQIDVVFGEHLPVAPEPLTVLGVPVVAATAGLSLAWKLQWLATDGYPQGKDLYDAVLLAEHTTVDLDLVRDLMRPELGDAADRFTAATVLAWTDVDWRNFTDAYPRVEGTAADWARRLALALDRPGQDRS
ncbi:nucleotidyl transferase AbiEii/AbiGii toxin family protein [Actinoplanes sp. NPDC026623]|uniref:nucleotidyl transferase AbiEii/AbiGii toxin family protein n=1 Tax=Actinoplanes sp. NPDC026623 TaxID=3155610 RepID=UPI0033DDC9BC